jgi:hypothetical protein
MDRVEHWRKLAKITRNVAGTTIDPADRQKLIELADHYDAQALRRLEALELAKLSAERKSRD